MLREILREDPSATVPRHSISRRSGESPAIPWLDPPPGAWTIPRAYAYCEDLAHAQGERLPMVSRLVQAEMRPHLFALCAFAGSAAAFAHQPEYEGRRVEALDRWEEELRLSCHGQARHPLFVALADTINKRNLPIPPLEDLLSAVRLEMEVPRFSSFEELRAYTVRSAGPVGRLLLALFGYGRPELVRFADEMSTALQLTRIWRDVAADAARDHIYIPAQDLYFFGVTEAEVKAQKATESLRHLLRFQVARTRAHYESCRTLFDKLGDDLRIELTFIWLIGTALLDKIEQADFDVFSHRTAIVPRDRAMIMSRARRVCASRLDLGRLKKLWP
jgi:hydroxysqualene synthase